MFKRKRRLSHSDRLKMIIRIVLGTNAFLFFLNGMIFSPLFFKDICEYMTGCYLMIISFVIAASNLVLMSMITDVYMEKAQKNI